MIDILLDLSMNAKINNTDQILVKYFFKPKGKANRTIFRGCYL